MLQCSPICFNVEQNLNVSKENYKYGFVMGSCLGHCRLARDSLSLYKFYSKARDSVDIQINNLANTESLEHTPDNSLNEQDQFNSSQKLESKSEKFSLKRLKTVFSNIKIKSHASSGLRLELLDDEWSIAEADCSARTESLGILPSANIRENKSINSASPNSLELEWEHLPEMGMFSSNVVDKEEAKSATSVGGWSRLSSADSLEWDPIDIEMKEEIDTETEQLLQEIEMLSSKTLQETQEWAS